MEKNACVFCKIIKEEIPAYKIYEDREFLAFLDIEPVSDGHLLIVPKKHIVWMQDADDETISGIFKLAKKLMLAVKKELAVIMCKFPRWNRGPPPAYSCSIPRYLDDGFSKFPTKKFDEKKAGEIVKKIIQAL